MTSSTLPMMPPSPPASAAARIAFLDGLRGVAILWVMLFHAYARWPDLVPYGDRFASWAFFRYGWLGVYLFFLLSGYVILMTLERCQSWREFLWRRWIRLFPAMLVVSAVVFLSAPLFPRRPLGMPTWSQLLPGLSFLEPRWWSALLGYKVEGLEGTFSTLYAEVKFYVFAAWLYFSFGSRKLIHALTAVFLLAIVAGASYKLFGGVFATTVHTICVELSFRYFGWFAAGAALYLYQQHRDVKMRRLAWVVGLLSAASAPGTDALGLVSAALVLAFFLVSLAWPRLQAALAIAPLLWLGFVSYPLYLIHENMMIGALAQFDPVRTAGYSALLPVLVMVSLAVLAHVLIVTLEVPLRNLLQRFLIRSRTPEVHAPR